jgi:hypothetical protein
LLRLARVDQPRVFPLRKIQRATSQRIDANLANQRSRNLSEVIVRALRRSRESPRAHGRPRAVRYRFQRELPQLRVSKGGHAEPRPHASVDKSLDIDVECSATRAALGQSDAVCRPAGSRRKVIQCAPLEQSNRIEPY